MEELRTLLDEGLWEAELSNSRTWALTCKGKKKNKEPAYDFHLSTEIIKLKCRYQLNFFTQ